MAAANPETLAIAAYLAWLEGNPDGPLTHPGWTSLPESERVRFRMVADAVVMTADLGGDQIIDPDCRDGKCGSCVGGLCQHHCHTQAGR